MIVKNPITKEKRKWRIRAEWVGIVLACLSVSGYLIGFQLWPWLQSVAKERGYTLIVSEIPSDMGVPRQEIPQHPVSVLPVPG